MDEIMSISNPTELKERVRIAAEADQRSVSNWVRQAIQKALENGSTGSTPKAG